LSTPETQARIASFEHDGLVFDVLDSGPLDGPVVVLLHGFPERASSWSRVSALLNEHGLRTIAPDQRGYSPRARPRGRAAYGMSRLVGDVLALIDEVGVPVHLVGHDWGAAVAWTTAARRPDRVLTLTAVSVPHPAAFLRSLLSSRQALKSWYFLLFQIPGLVELIARRFPRVLARGLRGSGMTAADVDRFHSGVVAYGALSGGLGWYRGLPFSAPGGVRRRVSVPTTHVWSDGDTALTRRGAELSAAYVSAPYELVVLTGVSHWVPTQAPAELAAAVLARVTGSRP